MLTRVGQEARLGWIPNHPSACYASVVEKAPVGWPLGHRVREALRKNLRELIAQEKKRARIHIQWIRRSEPAVSKDRLARIMLERWVKVASVEGGITGTFGFLGVPTNLILFSYAQIALVVSIAEAYDAALDGVSGEEKVLAVIGRAHGVQDLVRAGPRVVSAIARAVALNRGLGMLGRMVPMVAAPISAKLNERDMSRVGQEAIRRFGHVVQVGS